MSIHIDPRNWREGGPGWRYVALFVLVMILFAVLPRDLSWINFTVFIVGLASMVVHDIRKVS